MPAIQSSGRQSSGRQSPDEPQVFRSPTAVVVWVVWLLFAVGNWIDLAVQGRDHASAVAAAILLLATGAAYVTAQRPRIIADKTALTVRNPLRDHRIGWTGVAEVDLADLLRVHCRWAGPADAAPGQPGGKEHHKVISAWAVYYARRRQLAAEARARRAVRSPGPRRSSLDLPSGARGLPYGAAVSGPETSTAGAEAEKIVRVLSERATAAKAEAVWASGTAQAAGSEAAGKSGAAGTVAQTGTAAGTDAAETGTGRRGNRDGRGNRDRGRFGNRSRRHHGPGRRRLAWRVRAAEEHLERPGHRRPRHSRTDPAGGLASLAGPLHPGRADP